MYNDYLIVNVHCQLVALNQESAQRERHTQEHSTEAGSNVSEAAAQARCGCTSGKQGSRTSSKLLQAPWQCESMESKKAQPVRGGAGRGRPRDCQAVQQSTPICRR